jgi:hypothetical protein
LVVGYFSVGVWKRFDGECCHPVLFIQVRIDYHTRLEWSDSRFGLKVEFFNHRTLGQAARVTAHAHIMFYILDRIWRDADSVEQVVLTKIPGDDWARDIWLVPGKHQTSEI